MTLLEEKNQFREIHFEFKKFLQPSSKSYSLTSEMEKWPSIPAVLFHVMMMTMIPGSEVDVCHMKLDLLEVFHLCRSRHLFFLPYS